MVRGSMEVGFPKSNGVVSLREQLARTILRNVRLKGHTCVELRKDNKKPIFFCVLCECPCYDDTALHNHLRGHLHKDTYELAKATLLKENPWPFNDGKRFFHDASDEDCHLLNPRNRGRNILENHEMDEDSLAIVSADDFTSDGNLRSFGTDESWNNVEDGCDLIIPDVLFKDEVSNMKVRCIGVGKIGARFYEIDGVSKGITRIWCEWLGKTQATAVGDVIPEHDFAIVSFTYDCDLGRKGLLDDMRCVLASPCGSTAEENKDAKRRKTKSLSDPEDVSDSLSNQYESSGEESLAGSPYLKDHLDVYDDNALRVRLMRSKSLRKELRRHRQLASERVCDICQHKMLPGKDVATLLNLKTGRLACSSRNLSGAFHVFHISCLVQWVLLCDYEVYTNQLVAPTMKPRSRRKKGTKCKGVEKEAELGVPRKQISSAFCPGCHGTGMDIDGSELEKLFISISEMFRYKMKVSDAHRGYMRKPELLQNCSIGFYFPYQSEKTLQENVLPLKMLRFYRAVE